MVSHPAELNSETLQLEAFCLYRALMRCAASAGDGERDAEPNLGGRLLYAGELKDRSRAMVIAGNVAGCATLAAGEDATAQRQAMRDGVVDFVVTSLDEALRILKNEVRKRNAVAVSVIAAPDALEREMLERGVLPDLLFAGVRGEARKMSHFGPGEDEVYLDPPEAEEACVSWRVEQAPAQWMQRLDAIAIECLGEDRQAARWIRRGSRYFGRMAQGQRALYCDAGVAGEIALRFEAAVKDGLVGTSVLFRIGEELKEFRFVPGH